MLFAKRFLFAWISVSIILSSLYSDRSFSVYANRYPSDVQKETKSLVVDSSSKESTATANLPQEEKGPTFKVKIDIKPLFPEDFSKPVTIYWKIDSTEPTDWAGFELTISKLDDESEILRTDVKEEKGEVVLNDLDKICSDACYLAAILSSNGEEKAVTPFAIRHAEMFSVAKEGGNLPPVVEKLKSESKQNH